MINLNPIKPYLLWIKLGLVVLLTVGGFVTGCNHGEKNKQEEVNTLTVQVDTLKAANRQWADTAKEAKEQKQAADKLAEERAAANLRAEEALRKLRAQKDKENAAFEEKLRKAKEDPKCAELLKQQLCPLVSLPSR